MPSTNYPYPINTMSSHASTNGINGITNGSHPQENSNSSPASPTSPVSFDEYTRTMHFHTKQQMEAASRSARRRSPTESSTRSYETESSMDSRAS